MSVCSTAIFILSLSIVIVDSVLKCEVCVICHLELLAVEEPQSG